MDNVNDIYFDGFYKDIWRSIIPEELTVKEADFMMQYFGLKESSKVLDIMCGYGRHAIALAKRGIDVTAVDNLDDYISEINKSVKENNLSIKAVKADIMQYEPEGNYDLALCMGNSLNFFNPEDAHRLLVKINTHLKPGGYLFINTWSLAEISIRNFTAKSWSDVGELKYITDSKYLFHPTRIEFDSIFLAPDGRMEKKKAVDYIFSVAEMEGLLNSTGFNLKEIYSIPGKKKFTLGEPRAYIVAQSIKK
jgi:SAM-dependent methyltransferase